MGLIIYTVEQARTGSRVMPTMIRYMAGPMGMISGGDDGNDTIFGEGGPDNIRGGEGDDVIYGGTENDRLVGNQDTDWIFGNNGDDVIYGTQGTDYLYGNNGDDDIYGGDVLATSKSGTLLLRRDQGEMAVL